MTTVDIAQRRLDLMLKTGYPLVQENGQSRFGPPPDWTGPPPPKGSEVFIAKIPRDCFEDELVPLFWTIGQIYQLRLMMDFNASSRGFAFVRFTNPSDANQAMKELNGHEIRSGERIAVVKSLDNRQLFLANLPLDATPDEVQNEVMQFSDEVVNVFVPSPTNDLSFNRGYAFVEFTDHRAAAKARRAILSHKAKPWGREDIRVDWAVSTLDDEDESVKVSCLYFGNMKLNLDEKLFLKWVTIDALVRVKSVRHLRGYSFVEYCTRKDAEFAFNKLRGVDSSQFGFGEKPLVIGWGKPNKKRERETMATSTSPVSSPAMVKNNWEHELLYQLSSVDKKRPILGKAATPPTPPNSPTSFSD